MKKRVNIQYSFSYQLGSYNCNHNVAQLRRLREMFPNELVVIGVHSAKFPSEQLTQNIRQAVMRHGIEHPVVNDAGFKIWNSFAVRAWPTLMLIDPRGRIAGEASGEILAEEFAKEIRDVIQQNEEVLDRAPCLALPDAASEPARPLRYPAKILAAGDRLFISDTGHHRILEVRLDADGMDGELARVFGKGVEGLEDGPADQAAFNQPHGLGLDGRPDSGTLYVADTENHAVRAIDLSSGVVSTVAGTGQKAHGRKSMGAPTETALRSPWAVLPLSGYIFIAMAGSHQVWVLTKEGQLGPFAGNGYEELADGPVGESSFNQPSDLSFGLGYIFVADPEASAVRAISLNEEPRTMTLVGQGLFDFGDVDGPGASALMQHPTGLVFDGSVLYVADSYNHKIKLLEPAAGEVHTLIGSGQPGRQDGAFETAQLFEPEGVQMLGNLLYIADTNNHLVRVADLETSQVDTLRVRGLERLPVVGYPVVKNKVEQRSPVVVRPGTVRLALDVRLPPGYKRNPDMPASVLLGEDDQAEVLSFSAGQEIAWNMELTRDQDLPVELTLYYCQAEGDENPAGLLCLIHDQNIVVPLRVSADGSGEASIPVEVLNITGDGPVL